MVAEAAKELEATQFEEMEQLLEHLYPNSCEVVIVRSIKSPFESIDNDNSSVPSTPVKVSSVQMPSTLVV